MNWKISHASCNLYSSKSSNQLNMIQRIFKTRYALNQILLSLKKALIPLTVEEITILTDIENCLDCFEKAMNRISSL